MGGGMAGFLLLNWHKLDQNQRCYLSCIVGAIIIMNLLFSIGTSINKAGGGSSDILAHVGGLLSGFFLGMFVCSMPDHQTENRQWDFRVKLSGVIIFTTYTVLCALGIFVFRT